MSLGMHAPSLDVLESALSLDVCGLQLATLFDVCVGVPLLDVCGYYHLHNFLKFLVMHHTFGCQRQRWCTYIGCHWWYNTFRCIWEFTRFGCPGGGGCTAHLDVCVYAQRLHFEGMRLFSISVVIHHFQTFVEMYSTASERLLRCTTYEYTNKNTNTFGGAPIWMSAGMHRFWTSIEKH